MPGERTVYKGESISKRAWVDETMGVDDEDDGEEVTNDEEVGGVEEKRGREGPVR
jgi:hypothetical protein